MELTKDTLEDIELEFVRALAHMDEALQVKDGENARMHATECCTIAKVLGIMHGTGEDAEQERLYKKYHLYKMD